MADLRFLRNTDVSGRLPFPKLELPELPEKLKQRYPEMREWERKVKQAVEDWSRKVSTNG
jgi:hypothetical protein